MFPNTSHLEALAAFAMAFVAGAVSATSVIKYIDKVRRDTIVLRRFDL
jgi:ApbE superfamily uncharacterized protein (UPF0280 family)